MDATALIQSEARLALGAPVAPAYVYSERVLRAAARAAANVAQAAGCRLLYTLKACAVLPVLRILGERVDGFACSSAYETRLARIAARPEQSAHAYSPAFSDSEIADTLANADFLSLNSFSQMAKALRAASETPDPASLGIRINPEIRFADDERYDPCRPHSKLGVPLSDFAERARRSGDARLAEGAHVHSNCESDDLGELARTADALTPALDALPNLRPQSRRPRPLIIRFGDYIPNYRTVEIPRQCFTLAGDSRLALSPLRLSLALSLSRFVFIEVVPAAFRRRRGVEQGARHILRRVGYRVGHGQRRTPHRTPRSFCHIQPPSAKVGTIYMTANPKVEGGEIPKAQRL